MVQQVWEERYRDLEVISDDEQDAKRQKFYYNAFEEHSEQIRVDSNQAGGLDDDPFADDEFEKWQATHRNDDKFVRDPIAYWHEKRFQYPRLSRMALEWLSTFSRCNPCLLSVKDCSQPQGRWLSFNGIAFTREQ
ncbi:hypothetical protein LIPSTDRAFT_73062 [Lipomyces starkeyi NRRL Y-11557]|uniref:HAT C-terminal dimerisation domain-containing protein n=1 Tax=Lipomyces starkeyi NRRL Y-11557 TaxID=675824 RepID=A0A1E3Q138_LIPST|nr:hypothetical protein LIPSTDRAFT_73062 [Lipomyces starkeyi NRRL Y-11557]